MCGARKKHPEGCFKRAPRAGTVPPATIADVRSEHRRARDRRVEAEQVLRRCHAVNHCRVDSISGGFDTSALSGSAPNKAGPVDGAATWGLGDSTLILCLAAERVRRREGVDARPGGASRVEARSPRARSRRPWWRQNARERGRHPPDNGITGMVSERARQRVARDGLSTPRAVASEMPAMSSHARLQTRLNASATMVHAAL